MQYEKATKDRQDEIKDIGGFVGGFLTGGRRKNDTVLHRSLLTLDLDTAPIGFWDDFTILFDYAALIYSTHKHRPGSHRLRLLLPFDKPVDPCQYEAIGHWLAGKLGIEFFDDTGFQASRLMYWPSTSVDQEYEFKVQDGPLLPVDEILRKYVDYKDSSQWPVSKTIVAKVSREIKKQGDPLIKSGIIGAFCRCYTIEEAIEKFLPEVYEKCYDGRYTYIKGSTTAGLVLYENKFAYSHHGTDPASGKLCNAFDLVRIHKFSDPDTSFAAMNEFARGDKSVKIQLYNDHLEEAKEQFVNTNEIDSWIVKLETDKRGKYLNTISNIELILKNSELKNCLAWDEQSSTIKVIKQLPWRNSGEFSDILTDIDDSKIRAFLEKKPYEIHHAFNISDAITSVAFDNRFHPIKNYFENLSWDGIKRVETLFIDYFGAEDSEYTRTVTRKIFLAAVTRIYEPGIKFETMLVLIGKQGIGKSMILKKLGGKWHSDNISFHILKDKTGAERLQGKWIIEFGELKGMKNVDVNDIKDFISHQIDRYRVAYGKRVQEFPRQCVFFGTTNTTDFLRDTTGNRRFWPVLCNITRAKKNVFNELDEYEVKQFWAETLILYKKEKEDLFLSYKMSVVAEAIAEKHTEIDPWRESIIEWLEQYVPENYYDLGADVEIYSELNEFTGMLRNKITVSEIWEKCLRNEKGRFNFYDKTRIMNIMRKEKNWEEKVVKIRGHSVRGFMRKDHPEV